MSNKCHKIKQGASLEVVHSSLMEMEDLKRHDSLEALEVESTYETMQV